MNSRPEMPLIVPAVFLWLSLVLGLTQGVLGAQKVSQGDMVGGVTMLAFCSFSLTIAVCLCMVIADFYLFGPRDKH